MESQDIDLDEDKYDLRNVPKNILKEFILTYKNNPSLWQTKNKEIYNNKALKHKGWQQLVTIWKKFDDKADIKMVKAKVQSVRGSFRKEMRKVEKSRESGAEDVYVPQLWYYKLMMFVIDQQLPTESSDNTSTSYEANMLEVKLEYDEEYTLSEVDTNDTSTVPTKRIVHEPQCDSFSELTPPPRRKIRRTEDDERRQFLDVSETNTIEKENTNDFFGKFLAKKLDRVNDDMQRLYAETLINQVASYATMGYLNEHSRLLLNKHLRRSGAMTPSESSESSHDSYKPFVSQPESRPAPQPLSSQPQGVPNEFSIRQYYDHYPEN